MGTQQIKKIGNVQKKAQNSPKISTLFEIVPNVDPAISATMMQSNATTITAYEDAGAKFRDRTSRIEALRMYSTAVRSILMTLI